MSSCGSTPRLLSCRSETPSPLREKWKVRTGPGREEVYRAKQNHASARLNLSGTFLCKLAFKRGHGLWGWLFFLSPGLVPSLGVRDGILFNYLKLIFKAISAYHGSLKTREYGSGLVPVTNAANCTQQPASAMHTILAVQEEAPNVAIRKWGSFR